MMTLSYRRM